MKYSGKERSFYGTLFDLARLREIGRG